MNRVVLDLVATCMWTLSVAHSLDHLTMFHQPGTWRMRLRLPPPPMMRNRDAHKEYRDAVTAWDAFQENMFKHMFVNWTKRPSIFPARNGSLAYVHYAFKTEELQQLAIRFRAELVTTSQALTQTWPGTNHLPTVFEMSASVCF